MKTSSHRLSPFLLLTLVMSSSVSAVDYEVGGASQWNTQVDYTSWAADKTFNVGDNLIFNFAANLHRVDEVGEAACSSCGTSNPLNSHAIPPVKITLPSPGSMCFICPLLSHCSDGMKLQIKVVNSSTTTTTTTSPPSSPTPTSRASPPPPPPSGAALVASSRPVWLLGLSSLAAAISLF